MKEVTEIMEAFKDAPELKKNQYRFLKSLMNHFTHDGMYIDAEVMKPALPVLEAIEFAMQGVIGLPQNRKYHSYWNRIAHCTCPREDNAYLFGTGRRIYNEDCPYHNNLKAYSNYNKKEVSDEK